MIAALARREFLASIAATTIAIPAFTGAKAEGEAAMYGLIGKLRALPGKRNELVAVLLQGTGGMPGCLSYVVAKDPEDAEILWITEVWTDEGSHKASLSLPSVQAAIEKGRPLIAGFESSVRTEPMGGIGLPAAS